MSIFDKLEQTLTKPGKLSRRSAIGRISRGCAILVGAIAGISIYDTAHADGNGPCCHLAYPNNHCPNEAIFGCPCSNPDQWQWHCTYGVCTYICGECYNCQCSYLIPTCHGSPTDDSFRNTLINASKRTHINANEK